MSTSAIAPGTIFVFRLEDGVYILLKTKGAWLIDSNKVRGGEPGIL